MSAQGTAILGLGLLMLAVMRAIAIYTRGREPAGPGLRVPGGSASVGVQRSKGRVVGVFLAVDLPRPLTFSLYREGWFDRLAKLLGVARELQTGDEPFDGRVYIQSEDPALHEALQMRRELRARVLHLMRDPKTREVSAAGGRLWVVSRAYNGSEKIADPELVGRVAREMLPDLNAVLAELARVAGPGMDAATDRTRAARRWIAAGIGISLALAIIGELYIWWQVDHQVVRVAISRYTLWLTTAAGAAWLATLYLALGATAFTHRVLLDVLLAAVPAAWVVAFGACMAWNELSDTSAVRRVTLPVEQAWASRSRRSHTWHLRTSGWPDERADRELKISRDEYALISGHSCIDVLWRAGRLGDGWIEGFVNCADRAYR